MKLLTPIINILLFLLLGCTQESAKKSEYKFIKEYHDGTEIISHEGTNKYNKKEGVHKWYYPSGNLSLINNYKKDVEHGVRLQFYDTSFTAIECKSLYKNGESSGGLISYDYDGNIKSKEYYDKSNYRTHTEFYTSGGYIYKIHEYKKVHWNNEPVIDSWYVFDSIGRIIENESHGYKIIDARKLYYKDSTYEINLKFYPLIGERYAIQYGKMNDDYSFNDSTITRRDFSNEHLSIPITTKDTGKQILSFIIYDYDSVEGTEYDEKFHSVHGKFIYEVIEFNP